MTAGTKRFVEWKHIIITNYFIFQHFGVTHFFIFARSAQPLMTSPPPLITSPGVYGASGNSLLRLNLPIAINLKIAGGGVRI
jgi:hypothetical protein